MANSRKRPSGGAAIKAAGKSAMLLGWSPGDRALIEAAARIDGRPMTQFVQRAALAAAKKILKKSGTGLDTTL